jgi:hypothetical protein
MKKIFLIIISIIITSSCVPDSRIEKVYPVVIKTKTDYLQLEMEDGSGVTVVTRVIPFTYKDHNYIMFGEFDGKTIVHDPDCHCMQQYIPKKPESIWNY